MTKLFSKLAICGILALGLSAGAASAVASPLGSAGLTAAAVKNAEAASGPNLIQVDHWKRDRWRKHRPDYWRHYRPRSGFYFEFGTGGYRYNPYYLPPRVYARPPVYVRPRYVTPSYRLSSAHVNWCYGRYRSYRAYDNTFKPYHGQRRQCVSPFMR